MKMRPGDNPCLWNSACAAGNLSARFISEGAVTVNLASLVTGSVLKGKSEEFRARSVLVATSDQITAALVLLELDGIARRLILLPPDVASEELPSIIASAQVDAIVADAALSERLAQAMNMSSVATVLLTRGPDIEPASFDRSPQHRTEWLLFTSGTSGRPKLVEHTFLGLTGAIDGKVEREFPVVWSTFYDIRRYGGLQILLRAIVTGASLVLSCAHSTTAEFLHCAGARGVTHISGTPSHWRRALMSPSASCIAPRYVRLSGEIADQAILDRLRSFYPHAIVAHAFASTEAGVAFEVRDGIAGFPVSITGSRHVGPGAMVPVVNAPQVEVEVTEVEVKVPVAEMRVPEVEVKVEDGSLLLRSSRAATRYIGNEGGSLFDADGFVDTGDMVERRGDRYYFVGRRDGIINVGGMKVHPEEVEAVINRHPLVRMSLVRGRKNPITGGLVAAEVVLNSDPDIQGQPPDKLEREILQLCGEVLPRHKVPATLRFVEALTLAPTGKMVRRHA